MTSSRRERAHSRARALERHGIELGPRTRTDIISQIQRNEAVFLYRVSNRLKAFAVRYEDQWIPVYYDKARKEIVSVLPQGKLEKHLDKLPS